MRLTPCRVHPPAAPMPREPAPFMAPFTTRSHPPRVFGHACSSKGGSATSPRLALHLNGSDGNCGAILGSSWSCGGAVVTGRWFRHLHPLRKTMASLPVDAVPAHATVHLAPTEGIGDDHSALQTAGDAAPEAGAASARAFTGSAPRWSTGTSRVHLGAVRSRAQVRTLTQLPGTREISSCCGNTERTTRPRLVGQPSPPSCMGLLGDLDCSVILQFLDIELRGVHKKEVNGRASQTQRSRFPAEARHVIAPVSMG